VQDLVRLVDVAPFEGQPLLGRRPIAATMIGNVEPSSAATASISAHEVNVCTSPRFGSGFFIFFAGLSVM
jgi:hypothetical protein